MPSTIKTLDELINRKDRYDINNVTFYELVNDELVIPNITLFEIYRRYINTYVAKYRVSKEYRSYYRHKPYLLSTDVYGTPNLGWMILLLNDMDCASKFHLKQTINMIPGNLLSGLYDTLVTKSNSKLSENWNTYLTMVE